MDEQTKQHIRALFVDKLQKLCDKTVKEQEEAHIGCGDRHSGLDFPQYIKKCSDLFLSYIKQVIELRVQVESDERKKRSLSITSEEKTDLQKEIKEIIQKEIDNCKTCLDKRYLYSNAWSKGTKLGDEIHRQVRTRYADSLFFAGDIERKLNILEGELKESVSITRTGKGKNKSVIDISFVKEVKLIPLLERDWDYIQKCRETECWKAVIILCGSFLEAVLYDVLKQKEPQVMQTQTAIKIKKPLEACTLENYIDMSHDLNILTKGTHNFSHGLRDYRNLIHPQKEIAENYSVGESVANASFESLKVALEDIEKFFKP